MGSELSLRLVDDKEAPSEIQGDQKALAKFLAAHPEAPAVDSQPMVLTRLGNPPRKPAPTAVAKAG